MGSDLGGVLVGEDSWCAISSTRLVFSCDMSISQIVICKNIPGSLSGSALSWNVYEMKLVLSV
jgi:hypothetical protein